MKPRWVHPTAFAGAPSVSRQAVDPIEVRFAQLWNDRRNEAHIAQQSAPKTVRRRVDWPPVTNPGVQQDDHGQIDGGGDPSRITGGEKAKVPPPPARV